MVPADHIRQLAIKNARMDQAKTLQKEPQHHRDSFYSINRAYLEIDARCFRKISGLDRNFLDFESHVDRLRDHLGVEDEIIGVQQKRHSCQKLPAI